MSDINTPVKSESVDDKSLKEKTMKLSIAEGSFGVLSSTLSDNYIVPFALSIQSTPLQVGILSSLGGLVSPVGQIIGAREIEHRSRKRILLTGILGQACLWPVFMIIAFLYMQQIFLVGLAWLLILFYILYMICGGVLTPPWFSMMGDVVPENQRGKYFAKRNLICTAIALSGTLFFSFALDWFNNLNVVIIGFVIIFIFGLITRLFSALLFTQHYYPPFHFERTIDHISLKQFLGEIPKDNFGKFTLFVALLTFAQWIAGPFFSVHMLQDLKFNYFVFIFINLFTSIVALFIFPLLGKFSDKFGNVFLLRIGACIIPFLPLMWLFTDTPIEIALGPQLFSGIGWTAFNLAASNFIYDNIPAQKRGEYVALYNFIIGIGILLGGLTGSLIVTLIPITFMNKYHFLFLLSGIARIIVVIIFLPKIKEVRITTKPILGLKNSNIYRWLYDITVREHHPKKKTHNHHNNSNHQNTENNNK